MPVRTVGPEPGLQFGQVPAGMTLCQFGEYLRTATESASGSCANFEKDLDTLITNGSAAFADFTYFPFSEILTFAAKLNGGHNGYVYTFYQSAPRVAMDISDVSCLAYIFGTYLPDLFLPRCAPASPAYVAIDGYSTNLSFIGDISTGTFVSGNWDNGMTVSRWKDAWIAFYAYAKAHAPTIRLVPHMGTMIDPGWDAFDAIYADCPCLMQEYFPNSQGPSSNRSNSINLIHAFYRFTNEFSPVFGGDPPTRAASWGTTLDNNDLHSAFARYAMVRGPNTFFVLLDRNAHDAINPTAWLPVSEWLGAGTSAPTEVVGSGGSSLLMRTFAGGIAYWNYTGSPQTVTLPAGFTNWTGGPVSTATIADGKGDVFLAPTTGALPGSGGSGGGPGGGGPPPPPPPPVATATNTCCITIGAVPEIPDTPGTPNLYLAFIGTADVTGTALTLSADLMLFVNGMISNLVGFDSADFAFLDSPIMIYGAGLGGIPFWTTIAAIADARNVTLADAVPVNVTGKEVDCYFPIIQLPNAVTFKYYVRIGTYDMHSSLSTRPTLTFEIFSYPVHGSGLTFLPNAGQPALLIIEGHGDAFGGSIDQVQSENVPGKLPVTSKCQCVSWDQVLTKRLLMLTGAFPTGTNRDAFTGDGVNRFFGLAQPAVGIASVTLNGVPQTFALDGSGYLTWTLDSTVVYVAGIPPGAGAILVVTYQAAGAVVAPPAYSSQTADQIFFSLIQSIALSEGLAAIAVPGPLIDRIEFTSQDTVDSALQGLITAINDGISNNFWYWVSPRKVVHFEVQGVTQVAPWGIDVSDLSDANVLMQVGLTTTREKFANACWAAISEAIGLTSFAELLPGDGRSRSFQVSHPIGSIVSCTKIITTPRIPGSLNQRIPQELLQTGQVPVNAADAWYYTPNQTTITEDPANATMPTNTFLQVIYFPAAAITEQAFNAASIAARHLIEGGSGETDLYVNLGNTNAVLANATVAQNEVTYYAQMTQKLDVVTYRPGLQSGQGITVNLPNIGAVGLFIVDTIQIIDENGYWKWTVECSAGAIVGDWKKAMVRLANLL